MILVTDLGFRKNASAACVASVRGDALHVHEVRELLPRDGPLVPSEVLGDFMSLAREHGAREIAGDVYGRDFASEIVQRAGFSWVDLGHGPGYVAEAYTILRTLFRERRCAIPSDDELLRQLSEVRVEALPGGTLRVHHGSREGRHGDIVSTLTGAAWLLRDELRGEQGDLLSEGSARWAEPDTWDDAPRGRVMF